jgi:hypothetical protein
MVITQEGGNRGEGTGKWKARNRKFEKKGEVGNFLLNTEILKMHIQG